MEKPLLIFDGDCAFCSSSARLLDRMTRQKLRIEPYQFLDLESMGISLGDAQSAVQFLSNGQRFSGARAIAEALVASKTFWASAGWFIKAPVILSFAELVYMLIAKNRHRLPGGTPACQLRPKA